MTGAEAIEALIWGRVLQGHDFKDAARLTATDIVKHVVSKAIEDALKQLMPIGPVKKADTALWRFLSPNT